MIRGNRFPWLMGFGEGDYIAERRRWVDTLTTDVVVAEVRRHYEPGDLPPAGSASGREAKADAAVDSTMLTGEEVRKKGLDALERELGIVNAPRFPGMLGNGEGGYRPNVAGG